MKHNAELKKWSECFDKIEKGYGKSYRAKYLNYVFNLRQYDLPVIFELDHLALLLGRTNKFITAVTNDTDKFYVKFNITKRKGGYREICTPYPSLLESQRWICKNILNKVPAHESAHGFVSGKSIITNASMHLGCKELLKLDIKDFFGSISEMDVLGLFYLMGYSGNVSQYLTKLCIYKKVIPQGAATSPILSNLRFFHLDEEIRKRSQKMGLIYTRYADDISISGEKIPIEFVKEIKEIINNSSFRLNNKKEIHIKGNGRKIVTGLSVSTGSLKLPKETKRKIRSQVHNLIKEDYEEYAKRNNIKDPLYIESLIGKLNFWLHVEPNNSFARSHIDKIYNKYY